MHTLHNSKRYVNQNTKGKLLKLSTGYSTITSLLGWFLALNRLKTVEKAVDNLNYLLVKII